METLGFIPPAVPVAIPLATGLLGAAAALVKPLIKPPLPWKPGVLPPEGDGNPWPGQNSNQGSDKATKIESKWKDKARTLRVEYRTHYSGEPYRRCNTDQAYTGGTDTTYTGEWTFSGIYGFEATSASGTRGLLCTQEDNRVYLSLLTVKYWKVPEPEESDYRTKQGSYNATAMENGKWGIASSNGYGETNGKLTITRAWLDDVPFSIPSVDPTKPAIPEPELLPDPEETPKAPPLPGSPPPLPARPPLPAPVPDAPPFPVPGTPAQPDPSPGEDPATRPSTAPKPSAPPQRLPASPVPAEAPALDPAVTKQTSNSGGIIKGAPGLTPTTPSDAHYPIPGKDPVRGSSANPSPQAIAQELQRVEYKLNALMGKAKGGQPDWILDLLRIIPFIEYLYELFNSSVEGGQYEVEEKCQGNSYPDGKIPSRSVTFPEAADPLEGIIDRLDALGDLAQANFDLKVNTCGKTAKFEGKLVSVNFVSKEKSVNNNRPLRKLLRYRDLSGSSTAEHSKHWDGFEWDAGPVVVTLRHSSAGVIQCWAASESEGKRVIRFAASKSGFDPDADGEWQVAVSGHSRYGQTGRMMVEQIQGFNSVSKRDGPSGPPTLYR
jgi:hypothetical protein